MDRYWVGDSGRLMVFDVRVWIDFSVKFVDFGNVLICGEVLLCEWSISIEFDCGWFKGKEVEK